MLSQTVSHGNSNNGIRHRNRKNISGEKNSEQENICPDDLIPVAINPSGLLLPEAVDELPNEPDL